MVAIVVTMAKGVKIDRKRFDMKVLHFLTRKSSFQIPKSEKSLDPHRILPCVLPHAFMVSFFT